MRRKRDKIVVPKRSRGEMKTAVAAAGATALATLPTLSSATAALALAVAMLPPLVVLAMTGQVEARAGQIERCLRRVYEGDPERTPEEVKARVSEFTSRDPGARGAVIDAANALLRADESVTEAVAELSRPYLLGEPVDRFFRNLLAVLTVLAAAEFAAMQALFERLSAIRGPGAYELTWLRNNEGALVVRTRAIHCVEASVYTGIAHADRILNLLRTNNAGDELLEAPDRNTYIYKSPPAPEPRSSPPLVLGLDVIQRIARIVRE